MKTKNIFKTLAFAMLMPTMLLTTSCSSEDDLVNNTAENTEAVVNKGYTLPVTVSVTRQGDEATRANFNGSTNKLEFTAGDQLFIQGTHATAGNFAALLSNTAGGPGTFSGTLTSTNEYTGTFAELFASASSLTATLLPNGYSTEASGYLTLSGEGASQTLTVDATKAFVTATSADGAKALAIEQLSLEQATSYSSGFDLVPANAVLNYSISGLVNAHEYTFTVGDGTNNVSGSFTADASGNAYLAVTFAPAGSKTYTLDITGYLPVAVAGKTLIAGKVYNKAAVAVIEGALTGVFQVDGSGTKVLFSKGNLRATRTASSWSWSFAENQWDYIGNAAGNTTVTNTSPFISPVVEGTVVDLFGWVGNSSDWTGVNRFGITSSITLSNSDGYGNVRGESLKRDWGTLAITNGGKELSSSWRTLSSAEWGYILNDRTGSTINGTANARYTLAQINTDGTSRNGMILFPDGAEFAAAEATTWGELNVGSEWATKCTSAQWTALEAKGCVFLPAAGRRKGTTVDKVGQYGHYWTSTAYSDDNQNSRNLFFKYADSDGTKIDVKSDNNSSRYFGMSVRLARNVNN